MQIEMLRLCQEAMHPQGKGMLNIIVASLCLHPVMGSVSAKTEAELT